MYKGAEFRLQPMEWIEEDLKEIAGVAPDSTTIQLLSANPLCMTYDKLKPICGNRGTYSFPRDTSFRGS